MPIYSNMTKIRNISSKVMTNHGTPLSFRFYTLLPTCWIFKNTGFQVGLRSFFMTSVLQMGIWVPPSTNLEINKKGSCMTNKNIADTKTHDSHLLAKKENISIRFLRRDLYFPNLNTGMLFQLWSLSWHIPLHAPIASHNFGSGLIWQYHLCTDLMSMIDQVL